MQPSPGTRVGPYEILAPLGAGGMGEVYRARDTKLKRDVALKVLPQAFALNPDRMARFQREAEVLASLNHPNIAAIYGIEESALVMELVDGENLHGPLPLDTALNYARQIAEALAAAHERGIIHRDLKPANIMITPSGVVKVLDFGLAKIADPAGATGNPMSSPTLTARATEAGTILGTAAYMAPEQARGQAVDKRADIWAFGVVLYEMLTGKMLFKGETVSDTLAAVLTREPEWNSVPPQTERLLRRCLVKDPKLRLRDIGDARFLLEDAPPQPILTSGSDRWWKIGTAALALATLIALLYLWRFTRPITPSVLRLSVDLGEDAALSPVRGASMALSPDGSRLAFLSGQKGAKSKLAIRRLDQTRALPLAGTEGAEAPFFSADGKSIAFFADGKLKRIDAGGGGSITLCDAPSPREGSWGDDDNIVFARTNFGGLSSVPASGGTPHLITNLDLQKGDETHRYPQVLRGAQAVLFMNGVNGSTGEGAIEVQSLKTGARKTLVQVGGYGRYLPSGHLVYIHRGTLFAVPMDAKRLEVTGSPVPVLEDVSYYPGTGTAGFTFSQSGIFLYVALNPEDQLRPIGLLDEKGKVDLLPVAKARYGRPRVSRDGTRLAVAIEAGPATNIWIYEWESQRLSRLPFPNGNTKFPVWAPDGKYLMFSSNTQTPGPGIYGMRADGGGAPQRLVEGPGLVPSSLSSAAARLVYAVQGGVKAGLWTLPLDWTDAAHPKPGVPERFQDPSMDSPASFSLDGRWLAYITGQSGTPEVFVRPFTGPGGPWQISTGGGLPVWSPTGHELFYQGKPSLRIMVANYSVTGDSFSPGTAANMERHACR